MSREFLLNFTTCCSAELIHFCIPQKDMQASAPQGRPSLHDLQIRVQTKPSKPDLVGKRKVCKPNKGGQSVRGPVFKRQGNSTVWSVSRTAAWRFLKHPYPSSVQLWITGPVLLHYPFPKKQVSLLYKISFCFYWKTPIRAPFIYHIQPIWVKNAASSVSINILEKVFEINSKIK